MKENVTERSVTERSGTTQTKSSVILTGIKPTGTPHIGNYLGAIKPAIERANNSDATSLFFLANYHALNTVKDAKTMAENTKTLVCTWLACGLDPRKTIFYRQSDVPEIFELATILANVTPKGLLNRAHAYKAASQTNMKLVNYGDDLFELTEAADKGINMGLYLYPLLMAADILLFGTNYVPVGSDQKQHIEIASDIAKSFNAVYGNVLTVPKPLILEDVATCPGTDGRKMSKSYNNIIPIFGTESDLKKAVMRIVTDSTQPQDPKPTSHTIFQLYKQFASPEQVSKFAEQFEKGISWGDAKQQLFEVINEMLKPIRNKYDLYAKYESVGLERILNDGATRARKIARQTLDKVRKAIGVM